MENTDITADVGGVSISATAADAIRFKFNPSDSSEVARIKTLTGALITRVERIAANNPVAADLAKTAIDKIVTASMWSVLAATKGL